MGAEGQKEKYGEQWRDEDTSKETRTGWKGAFVELPVNAILIKPSKSL